MRLSYKIAWRYIFSKKSTNAINLITAVSMLGIVVGSAALIIVLSAFNGFEDLVKKLYSSFYPDIAVMPAEGKRFSVDSVNLNQLYELDGVAYISQTLEENAIIVYEEQEHIAVLKGVDSAFSDVTAVDDSVIIGRYRTQIQLLDSIELDAAVLGAGVADVLDVLLGPSASPLTVYMPRRSRSSGLGASRAFKQKRIYPAGIFRIQQDFDSRYVLVPLEFMRDLLEFENDEIGMLEIKLEPGVSASRKVKQIENLLPDGFEVKTRTQLNETVYQVMRTEKWVVYFVLTFILIVAAFNMIGSISMVVIDKQKDIGVLKSLGASRQFIQRVFLFEGLFQTMLSMCIGFLIAGVLLTGQILFEWVQIPGAGTFVVQAYPVKMKLFDFLLVFATIVVIGTLAAWFPAQRAARKRYVIRAD
jgi:lipoprotein-releasing system permease protein